MKRKRSVRIVFKGTTGTHGEALALVRESGDIALVERGRLRALLCMCPCGCGDVITVNLDRRADKAWSLYRRGNSISLYPSVWRDSGCESHFVVWSNRVLWLEEDWLFADDQIDQLMVDVLPLIPNHEFVHFRDIADKLDEIPWAVIRACRKLVRADQLAEGRDKYTGYFKKLV